MNKLKHLTDKQADKLCFLIDDEDTPLEMIDEDIGFIRDAAKREKRPAPASVQKQLNALSKALSGLSDEAKGHLTYHMASPHPDTLEEQLSAAESALTNIEDALDVDYGTHSKMKPHIQTLMRFLRQLDEEFKIDRRDGEKIAQVICKAAGIKCGNKIYWKAIHHEDAPKGVRALLANLFKRDSGND